MSSDHGALLTAADLESVAVRGNRVIATDASEAAGVQPKITVICSRFNGAISTRLCHGALDAFEKLGMASSAVTVAWVPGAFELPLAALTAVNNGGAKAVVCLGAVIRGDTAHFDFVAGECASGIQRAALDTGVPIVFGVLTTDTLDQALERCEPGESNKGYEAAITALEMIGVLGEITTGKKQPIAPHGAEA
ncbi:MAG: 6,7-dimethyl-8-ribityllumazine synthase [Acidimicrobiales bacterium]